MASQLQLPTPAHQLLGVVVGLLSLWEAGRSLFSFRINDLSSAVQKQRWPTQIRWKTGWQDSRDAIPTASKTRQIHTWTALNLCKHYQFLRRTWSVCSTISAQDTVTLVLWEYCARLMGILVYLCLRGGFWGRQHKSRSGGGVKIGWLLSFVCWHLLKRKWP